MIELNIDETSQSPLYKRIVEKVRHLVATGKLKPGEHLPTVRHLAKALSINPGTVARAYLELEQERVVVARRGGGTMVSARADDPQTLIQRQSRLSDMISSNILEVLSLGYSPEELEVAFQLHLARWREERKGSTGTLDKIEHSLDSRNTIHIVGSHDLALNLLIGKFKNQNPGIDIEIAHAGSLGGLIALQEDRADLAGIHLLDEETGEYNYPYVKHILPGREMAVVNLTYRIQGLMFAGGNPKQIAGLEDLIRSDIIFVNRQKGSGTRVLLDLELRKHGIVPSRIKGYDKELDTHLEVATSITQGIVDVGLGIEAAANTCGLGFLPLFQERYDLVIPMVNYHSRLICSLIEIISSEDFKKVVNNVGGYDTSQTGITTFYK